MNAIFYWMKILYNCFGEDDGVLTVDTFHLGFLPLSVSQAADHRQVTLQEAWVTLVADDGVDWVQLLPVAKHPGILHHGRRPT